MSEELLDKIQVDYRFQYDQCPDGSWDVWFEPSGHFNYCQECGKPVNENKVLNGVFRDTKEFDKIIGNLLNKINKKEEK